MGHQPNQTLNFKLKRDTKQRKWDTNPGETKMGHQPNETLELIIKCDTKQTKSDMRLTKWDTKQIRH